MSETCERLHEVIAAGQRLGFPFLTDGLPEDGVYILFERGEWGHGGERIVRVGTHTGKGRLKSRLIEHFLNENKDRSIFPKNIGRALLKQKNDPFLSCWELDLTTKGARGQHASLLYLHNKHIVEGLVSKYIRANLSFAVLRVQEKERRLQLESRLLSTLSNCRICCPSDNWLGLFSPKAKIRESGLWNVNELYKTGLAQDDLTFLEESLLRAK